MTTELATRDPEVLARLMTEEEAREAVAGIKRTFGSLRAKLVELDEREGWRALGYASIEACCAAELGWKKSHLYRQLTAGAIERNLGSPIGEQRESHLRPLTGKPPEVQQQAWEAAGRDGERSALSVRRAVEKVEKGGEFPDVQTDWKGHAVTLTMRDEDEEPAQSEDYDAETQPERARGADTGAGSAGAEAPVQDAGAEEGKTKAAGFVYTMDPGLDDWTVTPIERKAIQRNGDTLGSVLAFYHLAVAAATDESGGVARQRIMRTLLKQARQRSE